MDRKIEEIRKKYSNKSEYIPAKPIRQQSAYKDSKPRDSLFERDARLSKYFTS